MRNNIFRRLLLISLFSMAIGSCNEQEDSDSVKAEFGKYPVNISTETPAVVVSESDEDTYTFKFSLSGEYQTTDLTLHVGVGTSTTATEDVDFTLDTHEVELLALQGQDGFEVEVTVLQDGIVDEEDETIYLTFSSETPSGLVVTETKVITIEDSGVPGNLEISLSWDAEFEFDGEAYHLADFTDLDFYLYDADYNEITGFQGATGSEPEELTLAGDIADGTYEVWVNFWDRYPFESEICQDALGNDYACLGPFEIPLVITFSRNGVEQSVEYPALTLTNTDVWYRVNNVNTNPYNEYLVAFVEVSGGSFTLFDIEGANVGSLKMKGRTMDARDKVSQVWPSIR